ncbi:MAG: hypothetical protein ACLPLR_20760 [Terriglobales bacterium]
MPILMMALLALIVFGAIGILLTTAVILEHSAHTRALKHNAAHPVATALASGAVSSRDAKLP